MSAFKLHTLKQKLWAVVAASFVARFVMFFALPNTPSFLAPDEGIYAYLTKWIGESKPADQFPAFGEGLYLSGRSFIAPASGLYRLGFNELDAIRLIATLYGFSALILLVFLILKLYNKCVFGSDNKKYNENLILILFFLFSFIPSHFVWSNLGLRESATEFWMIASIVAFFLIFHDFKKITAVGILVLVGSIALTFSARPQVGWVVGVALVVFLSFNFKTVNTYFLIPLVLCGVVLGATWNSGTTATTATTSTTSTTSTTGSVLGNVFGPLLSAGELVTYKQEVNQFNAASVIKTQSCPQESRAFSALPPTTFDTYFCIAWRAPYMVSTFLFRPIIGLDVTSTSSLFAAAENILWMALFGTIIVLAIRRRAISFIQPILPATIFFVLYVLGASAYQGNMGTGFRHKSLILWAVLLIIFALAWRKSEESENSPRDISSESAV